MSNRKLRVTMTLSTALALALCTGLVTLAADDDGFEPIFNGESLEGWAGDARFWRVEEGVITGETTEDEPLSGSSYLIWEGDEPGDFELRLEYRILSEWANSGINVRSVREEDEGYVVGGYQADIATEDWITGILFEERGRDVLARRGQKTVFGPNGSKQVTRFGDEDELGGKYDPREWTEYRVTAEGERIVSKINGHLMHEVIDGAPQARRHGVIALQLHGRAPMTIQFRNIRLRYLDADE